MIYKILGLTGVVIVGSLGYFFLMPDNAKIAEIISEETIQDQLPQQNLSKFVTPSEKREIPVLKNVETKMNKDIDKVAIKEVMINKNKTGGFIKIDPLHYASGQVTVEKFGENYKLKFQNNFSSANGPDLYVYLSEKQNFKNIAIGGLDTKKTLNLGLLKNIKGEQEYLVSKNDFEKYDSSVIIWCKQFGVQFSRADLK